MRDRNHSVARISAYTVERAMRQAVTLGHNLGLDLEGRGLGTATAAAPDTATSIQISHHQPRSFAACSLNRHVQPSSSTRTDQSTRNSS